MSDEHVKTIQILGILVGCITPIVGYFTVRIIKSNDKKIEKLFDICDEIKENKIPLMQQRISQLEEAIRWLKEK